MLVRPRAAIALPLLVAVAWLGGCSSSTSAPGESAGRAEATTSAAAAEPAVESPTGCGGDGPGIVRAACDGTAVVSFTIDGEAGEIAGGSCDTTVAYLEVAAGTQTGDGWEAPRLDFADLLLPVEQGDFTGAEVELVWDGLAVETSRASGSHDGTGGSFSAELDDGRSLRGTFTC